MSTAGRRSGHAAPTGGRPPTLTSPPPAPCGPPSPPPTAAPPPPRPSRPSRRVRRRRPRSRPQAPSKAALKFGRRARGAGQFGGRDGFPSRGRARILPLKCQRGAQGQPRSPGAFLTAAAPPAPPGPLHAAPGHTGPHGRGGRPGTGAPGGVGAKRQGLREGRGRGSTAEGEGAGSTPGREPRASEGNFPSSSGKAARGPSGAECAGAAVSPGPSRSRRRRGARQDRPRSPPPPQAAPLRSGCSRWQRRAPAPSAPPSPARRSPRYPN